MAELTDAEKRMLEQKTREFRAIPMKTPCPVCRVKMQSHCRDRMRRCLSVFLARELLPPKTG